MNTPVLAARGGLDEVVQAHLPGHVVSGRDRLADVPGVAPGGAAAGWLDGHGIRG